MTSADQGAAILDALRRWSQDHVLELLQSPSAFDSVLWSQLLHFESWYPGGLNGYLTTASALFTSQTAGATPDASASAQDALSTWVPSIPSLGAYSQPLSVDSALYQELEAEGLAAAADCAFVVVAGGLGERLGYSGIKLALPVETLTHTSYLEYYIHHIRALEAALRDRGVCAQIPLAIMTSEATHDATQTFLEHHNWFGLPPAQITLLKQDVVPCLDARLKQSPPSDGPPSPQLQLVVQPDDPSRGRSCLIMKPHGHGDVHTLLHSSGIARQWLDVQHKRFVHFIQDTNYLILNSTLPLLGATVRHDWAWAFTGVPRKAKDASGALVQFTSPQDPGHSMLCNIETYVDALERSGGRTPEIFNPKLAATPLAPSYSMFNSPARLECMMQDFPRLFAGKETAASSVGMLLFPASLVYSPCKNDTLSAASKATQDIPPQCASSAEHDLFALNIAKLRALGVSGPHVVFCGGFGFSNTALRSKFPEPSAVKISPRSTLIVHGQNITIHALELDGAVEIVAHD
ncbi:hypothetical protein P43SY_002877 [Pythium insidiosum]|uniref:UTP-monosaccharide-1-phosphate uridylyltransferase n=1 Tax=Pythium insidiosum TaxID=114742 RepID=A0AAD5Q391_PYTIN|nr:hypothetical protein P43SY_002877 [Pythium insidiosum]